jgi:tetratricopeptide (TPR) repeat protein
MPIGPAERYDFFLSRRGSVASFAQEVTDVLTQKGYRVFVQDYDIPISANFIDEMHEAVKNARDLVVLFTRDYEQSPYTRMEFTSFEANAGQSAEKRRMVILRCEDAPLLGLFAPHVYQDLVGVGDADERRSRILAAAEGRSQALQPPPRPFMGVPPRIASFTGRADELDRLDAILMRDKPAAVTQTSVGRAAVQGMGGVGKTSLSIEYAHRYRSLYAGVCWCPAEVRVDLLSSLASLAVTLGAATAEEADVEKAAKAALRRLAEQRATWLLVYDNVPEPKDITELLPSAGARVLITSRFSDWSEVADEVALDVLPAPEATDLLQTRSGRSDSAGSSELAEALGRLPLALDHAAAFCKRTQMQFGDYAKKAESLIEAAPRGASYPRSVAATFNLAIAEAVAQCHSAEALMAYLAQCGPERIPMVLLDGAIQNEAERLNALTAVAELSLVKQDPFADGTPAVTVHRLVQLAARARSEVHGGTSVANERLCARLSAVYPGRSFDDPTTWPVCAQLVPHLLKQSNSIDIAGSDAIRWPFLFIQAGRYLQRRASYKDVETLLRVALEICERRFSPNHPQITALSLNCLALLLREQDRSAEARSLLERAVEICEKALGAEHAQTGSSLGNLGLVLQDQRDFAGARRNYERALKIAKKEFGADHQSSITICHSLAGVLHDQGDYSAARPLYDLVVAARENTLGPTHPETGSVIYNLARLLEAQGDLAGARSMYERALQIYEAALGATHPWTAKGLSALADLLGPRVSSPRHGSFLNAH